jgi:hypothetical protein
MQPPIQITIPGLPPPQNARSACDVLRPRYTRSTVLVLAARNGTALENLRTIVVFGSSRLRPGPDRTVIVDAKGDQPECRLIRRTVDAAEAEAFSAQARGGTATPPTSAEVITYRLESWWEGLLPRNSLAGGRSPSSTLSVWRRRRQPTKPGMFGTELSKGTVRNLLSRVPALTEVDWELLNLRDDVAAFEALDEYYLIPVRIEARHRSSSIDVEVADPDGWLPAMNGGTLRTEGYRFGLRQTASTIQVQGAGHYVVPLNEPSTETVLEADGIALDVSGGWFIGAPQNVAPISGGILPDVLALSALADEWVRRDRERRDVVLDPRARGTDPAASGRDAMRQVLSGLVGGIAPVSVDLVDPFHVTAEVLRTIATTVPYGSTIRLVCGEANDDADFAAVRRDTGVAVERYRAPDRIPQHDRFLRIGGRLWSIGTSFNHLGHCFSAILEVRDPVTFGEIGAVIDACLTGPPEAAS